MKNILFVSALLVATPVLAKQPATMNACMACHQVDKKVVGPSFKDVAAKYSSKTDAVDYLAKSIKNGGSGKWGQIPMPAQPQLTEAQAKEIARVILSYK